MEIGYEIQNAYSLCRTACTPVAALAALAAGAALTGSAGSKGCACSISRALSTWKWRDKSRSAFARYNKSRSAFARYNQHGSTTLHVMLYLSMKLQGGGVC